MTDLSIIIVTYNTLEITRTCIEKLYANLLKSTLKVEIIVVDNDSKDDTLKMLEEVKRSKPTDKIDFNIIRSKKNIGFAGGNNIGVAQAVGRYLLFLNSDLYIDQNLDFKDLILWMTENSNVGVLTVRVNLEDGTLDAACHRGFPTPWRSLTYFLKLEKLFGSVPLINRIFGGYHLTYLNLNQIHEIDSPQGSFYLTRTDLFKRVGGFSEDFFMYGEELDLSIRIKKLGYKIYYYPKYSVTHLKYQSGLKTDDREIRQRTKDHFYSAMKIFYKKHYAQSYPSFFNNLVYIGIDLKRKIS